MELSLGGLVGAAIGAVLGAVNFAIIAPMIESRLRAAAQPEQGREELERRIAATRRTVLAFEMLVFVGAGYWIGTSFW